jgi:hypothetical protein
VRGDRVLSYFGNLRRHAAARARRLPAVLAARGLPLTGHDRRLAALKNRYAGRRCFVIGNGPSLKRHDLRVLRDEHVFVTNWFVLHEEFLRLNHCYYCVTDPHFWNFGGDFHADLVARLKAKPGVRAFFADAAHDAAHRAGLDAALADTFFVRLNTRATVCDGVFSPNILKETHLGYTVIIDLCLPVAHFLGFTEVYLLGCDCDYRLDQAADLSQSFFYDINRVPARDVGHLMAYKHEMNQLDRWNQCYRVVKDAFQRSRRSIYNAGYGGKLEVFDRVQFDSLFPTAIPEGPS